MTSSELSQNQREILDFIASYTGEHGYPPTQREIGEHMGIVVSGVNRYLKILEGKGKIKRKVYSPRAIKLL